jgi:ankyrin repeat protein
MAVNRFRWVFCQLETLRNCLPQNVRRVLKDLPISLDETYERMLKEIGKVNPRQAYRLLQCLTVARRPLLVDELAEVLALDFDRTEDGIPTLNLAWRWDDEQQGVLSTCSSLIVIINDQISATRVVQFAHFSVKEFLTSDRLSNLEADIARFHIHLEPAHTVIAQAGLAILLRSDSNKVDAISPLHKYAAQHWVDHAQFENVSLRLGGMRHLFDPEKPYFAGWLKSHIIDKGWKYFLGQENNGYSYSFLRKPASSIGDYAPLCLYYASMCGFPDITQSLISKYPQHVNARVGYNKSPLVAALFNRHWQVADLLHRNGAAAEVTILGNITPLHAASVDRMIGVARWLLEHGADGNSQMQEGSTPLLLATVKGYLEIVRTLLEHGVDVNTGDIDEYSPLHYASRLGHINIVRLLIQHGADANTHIQQLLNLASSSGSVETVRLFIELGAHVNESTGQECKTALHIASSKGHTEIVQLLIKYRADVNSRDRGDSTPLHLASRMGDASTIELLLQVGADVNARAKDDSAPLHRAAFSGSPRAVELLLQRGAEVNACDGAHLTPLHKSLLNKPDVNVVRLLLENGANAEVEDDEGQTPFQIASSKELSGITRLFKPFLSKDCKDYTLKTTKTASPAIQLPQRRPTC